MLWSILLQILPILIEALMKWLFKKDPTYTLEERAADEAALRAAKEETKRTRNAKPLEALHERIRNRKLRRMLAMSDERITSRFS